MFKKAYGVLNAIRTFSIVALLISIITLSTVQIVLRYLTGPGIRPFSWADELIRMGIIWVAFLASSLGVKESAHLSVSFFVNKYLPKKVGFVVGKIATLILLAVLAVIIYNSTKQVIFTKASTLQNLPTVSMAWFYSAVPVGCALLFIDYLLILFYGEHPFSSKKLKEENLAAQASADTALQATEEVKHD